VSLRPVAVGCLVLAAAGLMASCKVPASDVGKPCILVKRAPADAGVTSVPVKESEVVEGRDFISFGSTECDDYVCVRDKDTPKSTTPQVDAVGYCSKPCAPTNPLGCAIAPENQGVILRGTCRAMLLDEETLNTLCTADPNKCQQYFGSNRSPYFCARDTSTALPDGGADGGGTSSDGGTP